MVTSVPIETRDARNSSSIRRIDTCLKRLCGLPVLLAILIAGGVFLTLPKTNGDPDIGWHLRNAQYQLQQHVFLHQDIYSFTTRGKPWMDHEWLAEIPFYLGWKWFGTRGLFCMTYALTAATLLGIFGLARMHAKNPKAAFLVSVLAIPLASVSFGPRTLLFGWVFLILELAILYSFRDGRNFIWLLPPIFLVWINTHGSWVIGFVLLLLFAISGCVDGRCGAIEAKRWTVKQRRALSASIFLSFVALLVNPYGWRLIVYPFDLAFRQKLNVANVVEWRSLDFHSPRGKIVLGILVGAILLQLLRQRRWMLHEVMFLLVGVYAGFTYLRFILLTAILVLPILARDIKEWVPGYRAKNDKPWLNLVIIVTCIAAICVEFPTGPQLVRAESSQFPDRAQAYLNGFHPSGNVLNDYLWGGYMTWNLRQIPVFIDSRVDVFERSGVFKDYLDATQLRGTLGVLDKYRVRYVLFRKDSPLSYFLKHTPGWKIDFQDKTTILFERVAWPAGKRQ